MLGGVARQSGERHVLASILRLQVSDNLMLIHVHCHTFGIRNVHLHSTYIVSRVTLAYRCATAQILDRLRYLTLSMVVF